MDLAALWTREKDRVAAELHDAKDCRRFSGSIGKQEASTHRSKSSVASASPTVKPSKRRASVACNGSSCLERDRVFQLLLESSIAPFSKEAVPHFSSSNEFAMEYADRAVRRFIGSPQPAQQQPQPTVPSSNNAGASVVPRGPVGRSQSAHVSSILLALHGQSPSTPVQATPSVQANPAFQAMSKTAQLLRKNGRKRAGTEFSSQTLKPYVGDMFSTRGDYVDGMLYMSRMKRSFQVMFAGGDPRGKKQEVSFSSAPWGDFVRPEGRSVLKDGVSDAFAVAANTAGNNAGKQAPGRRVGSTILISAEDVDELGATLTSVQRKQQQRCSLTLSNWSFNPENARLMVQENVVEALIRLCKDGDQTTTLHCVTALMNISHLVELRRVIVQQGAVKTVAEVVNDMEDKTIRTACAITLCNLCSLQGEEGLLVEDGAVSALSTLINEHEKVSRICRSALFNLTCVSQSYHKIESVLKAFIALTTTRSSGSTGFQSRAEEEYDDITAKALCNLSNLKRIRLRLMEEGIVSAIASLLHPNIPLIQELLAHILLNLSRLPACRSEMVAKGCMGTLVALAGASTAIGTNYLIASTLWHLSKDSGNAVRMVSEGLLSLVTGLCRDVRGVDEREEDSDANKEEDLLQVCARTVYNVSCCEDARAKLVERDAVTILSSVSRRSGGEDAKQMCTLALCNLLSVQKAAADIVTAGAITALIELSMAPAQSCETRNLFSKALHGLCEKASTRAAVTDAGVIPALLFLSSVEDSELMEGQATRCESPSVLKEVRARCTAAFACLAVDPHTAPHVCNAAVVRCVTRILVLERSNVVIERFCCSCLSLLCRDEQCSLIMVEVGAIEMVLTTCVESHDMESKASCCHVLASVSCHPSCCTALVRLGVISVLATLARVKEDVVIQRCCAITLANLSVEPDIRETLASAGIVSIVSVLSNSYSEDSQRDCAKVLCNLSCIRGNEATLVKEGAVGALMMISMVRAVSIPTKETCIRALLNLLNAETMKAMVKEGLVKILPAFSGLTSKPAALLVTIIFSKLLNHPVGRNALCTERPSLAALFHLMTYDLQSGLTTELDAEERRLASLHEELLSELVYYENSRLLSVHTGILDALHRISVYEERFSEILDDAQHHCAEKKLALVIFTLAKSEDSRMAVAASASLSTLLKFLRLHSPKHDCDETECALFAVATLCWLGWHDATRQHLQLPDIPSAVTKMLQIQPQASSEEATWYSPQSIKTCVLTLCCLTHSSDLMDVMLKENVMTYLNDILASKTGEEIAVLSTLADDKEFVALVCILFRQLSHIALFGSAISDQPAPILELFCVLVQRVVETTDVESSLDCADALCSIVFALDQSATDKTQATRPSHFLVESRVLTAIGSLMSDSQLPETRWRCAASLWALASVPEYRRQLVGLGVTKMLVDESYRAAKTPSLNTLQCCAGALCSLTIVSEEENAAKMVEEGAMPALIHLAKLENETIREYCTLALSNLSGPSPKVESGAVSALLNLSLDFPVASASPTSRRGSQPRAVLSRPPVVSGERHKQFAVLPDFAIAIANDGALNEQKFEAELTASTPPPPHLPAIAADLLGASTSSNGDVKPTKDSSAARPDTIAPLRKEESVVGPIAKSDQEYMQTRFFGKVGPEESLALMTATEERDNEEDVGGNEQTHIGPVGNQEQDAVTETKPGSSRANGELSRLTDHGNSLRKAGSGSSSNYTLSPLSRVVARKTHTVQAVQRLREAAARKAKKDVLGWSQSSPCLTKPSNPVGEDSPEHRLGSGKSTLPKPPSLSTSVSTSVLPLPALNEKDHVTDPHAALLAAVSAAGLYDAAPPKAQSRPAKDYKKALAKHKKREAGLSDHVALMAEPKAFAPATTVEEFQVQAKQLGLWS